MGNNNRKFQEPDLGTDVTWVVDSGALIEIEKRNDWFTRQITRGTSAGTPMWVPLLVVLEVWHDPKTQHTLTQFLKKCVYPVADFDSANAIVELVNWAKKKSAIKKVSARMRQLW